MATMPDLDPSSKNIGALGYWNAIEDGGASSINAGQVVQSNKVESWESYDNGVTGQYLNDRRFRVKTDGWVVVYHDLDLDTPEPFEYLADTPRYYDPDPNITDTRMGSAIDDLVSQTDTYTEMTFNHSDVGVYNYRYPDASYLQLLKGDSDGEPPDSGWFWGYAEGNRPPVFYFEYDILDGAMEWDGERAQGTYEGYLDTSTDLPEPNEFVSITPNVESGKIQVLIMYFSK